MTGLIGQGFYKDWIMASVNTNVPDIAEGLVTTIIPVYNRAGMIRTAVQSVLDQTYRPIEIILVDDGSTDDTLPELNRLAAEHPDIIRVAHRDNGGPGLARETGRLLATGEFIQYLDSDDLLLPGKFEVQVTALRERPECGIAYGRTRLINAHGSTLRETSKWTGKAFDRLFPALLVDRWWHTSTPLYRRSLCDQIGPWLEQQPEDWDYDARAGATGTPLAFCNEVISCHRDHEGHRITDRPYENYLPQEAWFLPRLYACALQARVPATSPEMRHFVRWAFSLSRRVAATGRTDKATELLDLAVKALGRQTLGMLAVRMVSKVIGVKRTGKLCQFFEQRMKNGPGDQTMHPSWVERPTA